MVKMPANSGADNADFRDTSYETSIELSSEKGAFPNFDWSGYSKNAFVKNLPKTLQNKIKKHGIRNSTSPRLLQPVVEQS